MRLIVVFLILPILVFSQKLSPEGQTNEVLASFFEVQNSQTNSWLKFQKFVDRLERKDVQDDHRFLQNVFTKTHAQFLKRFSTTATFEQTARSGIYNCLTATAVYGLILQELGYTFQIVETNYHIFILAQTSRGKVLLETTDPINGFVTDTGEIESRTLKYLNGVPSVEASSSKTHHAFEKTLYNVIDLQNLAGLMHYNQSVAAYNQNELALSVQHLQHARKYYNSSRIAEFSTIVLLTVAHSALDPEMKADLMRKVQALRSDKSPIFAMAD